jgi:hypothetical protein
MSEPSNPECGAEAQAYRELLAECEQLFRSCAEQFAEQHPDLIHDTPEHFLDRMLELHRGLILKVFAEIAQADHRISAGEMKLARELFDHAWHRRLTDDQLKESIFHYSETTHIRWDSLLWPFERLSAFRGRANEVFALVQRMALTVAGANKRVDPRAVDNLRWILSEMQRVILPVPMAGGRRDESANPIAPVPPRGRSVALRQGESKIEAEVLSEEAQAVRHEPRANAEELSDVLTALDALIGLGAIKADVRELIDFLKMQEQRKNYDLPQTPISLHAVFTGNPGTGKTTVARLFGRILGAMGILAKGHLIETDRSGLVAEYAGQTAPRTNKRINEALDGVLFIDEAYSLVADSGEDPYGTEALQTLLKRMEDDRDRLVVILAGYPGPMTTLLQSNPGLSSRFSRMVAFPDYTAIELGRVFATFCQRDHYRLPPRTRAKLLLGFRYLLDRRDEHFGNGRLARTIFEHSVRRLASRLARADKLTKALLTTLQPEDIVMEGTPATVWNGLENDARGFLLTCPGCQHAARLPQRMLGSWVTCPGCQCEFEADWGEIEEPKARSSD